MPGRRRPRSWRPALIAGGVALAVLAGTPAFAAVARTPIVPHLAAASSAPSGASLRATRLHGWHAAPARVAVRQRFAVAVRVSGGQRIVRLERRLHGEWRRVDRERTSAAGRAVLGWRADTAAQHVVLRVRVPATATDHALRSHPLDVRIVRAVAAAPRAATAVPAPTAVPVATASPSAVPVTTAAPSATPTPVASPTPTPTATPAATPAPTSTAAAAEAARLDALREPVRARLLVLVNEARATPRTCGDDQYPAVPSLGRSTALDTAAGGYADQMAFHDFFSHVGLDGSTMSSRLNAVGVRDVVMRENIAAGQKSADAVMADWLGSPGHCANIMAADVTTVGFGHTTATDSHFSDYWVQDFAG